MKRPDSICGACLWNDNCSFSEPCEDFTPINDELTEAELDELIEEGRVQFYGEWAEYVADNFLFF